MACPRETHSSTTCTRHCRSISRSRRRKCCGTHRPRDTARQGTDMPARKGRGASGAGTSVKNAIDVTIVPAPDPEVETRAHALAEKAPVPARVGTVSAGTAGWTDPTLVKLGGFYPHGVNKPEDRL